MTNEAKHKEIIMQKNEFEVMVKELLPDVTAQAMEKWTQYAQELEQDGTEKESDRRAGDVRPIVWKSL